MDARNFIKGFTLMELMVVMAVISLLSATALSLFSNYQSRSKTTEAMIGIQKIAEGEVAYFTRTNKFIDAAPIGFPPGLSAKKLNFSVGNWPHIGFDLTGATYYAFAATMNGAGNEVNCTAFGDLDADGDFSIFIRRVYMRDGKGIPLISGMLVTKDIE